jgi:pimeloyl-ACP methyl ester carboxylesterase
MNGIVHMHRRSPTLSDPTPVIALHCSGSGAGQWRALGASLDARHGLVAPEHYGCESVGPWTGAHAFTLADEAARTIEAIDRSDWKVHLVGHSYGGAVALHAAIERRDRIASLTLYEPTAFHLLKTMGERGMPALAEIRAIAARTAQGVITGNYRGAAVAFIDYWSGPGTWATLRPAVQESMTRWMPKAPLDFRALIDEPTRTSRHGTLRIPTLILRGEHAPSPTRLIAEALKAMMPSARLQIVAGAGHMGPITHAKDVNAAILRQIAEAEAWADLAIPA